MTYNEDIERIERKLSKVISISDELKIVFEIVKDYHARPYYPQLLDYMFSKIALLLGLQNFSTPEESQKVLSQYLALLSKAFTETIIDCQKKIEHKEFDVAIEILEKFESVALSMINNYKEVSSYDDIFFCSGNTSLMEKSLAGKYFHHQHSCVLDFDIVSLYITKAEANYYKGDTDTAERILKDTFAYNPVDVKLCFLLSDIQWQKGNHYAYISYLDKAWDFMFYDDDFVNYLQRMKKYLKVNDSKAYHAVVELLKYGDTYKAIFIAKEEDKKKKLEHQHYLDILKEKGYNYQVSDMVVDLIKAKLPLLKKRKMTNYVKYYTDILDSFGLAPKKRTKKKTKEDITNSEETK